ncbi:ADP-ribosyltransferase [Clostridium perfringens]|uniref:Iota-like protein component A n=1 Tax=Clostridium perfringens TaxID=1502 RepID=A0A411AMH7_CLOPF|nr:ADP-ribosyltransferase [Clostridium perfringens]QAX89014.1 iota-like protein component A [Clostridium perfringens]QDB00934.1 iota-like protein component A [Clostridium perfringens]HAT4340548.1 iota toxin protein Ia [Clostridium perfringens]HAT4346113.1 iota toxin protein Ia [Clostridium perfringens]HAT4365404.1 iota toxin protein Ia [Clostridium perfringens]
MKKVKKYISMLLILYLILTTSLPNLAYAQDLQSQITNKTTKVLIERPEDFLKDKEKAKEWERSEAERIERKLEKSEIEALESYKKDSVEINEYSQIRNYFYDYQIEANPREKEYKELRNAVSKNKIDKPINVYYFESPEKFAFNKEIRSADQNEISLDKFNEFKETVQNKLFKQDGFKNVSLYEPGKGDKKPTPLLIHLKLPKNTGMLPYKNSNDVSTLIEQGYSVKIDKIVRIVIEGKQYIKATASVVNSLDFKDDVSKGDSWGKANYSDWSTKLTSNELADVNDYMRGGYIAINNYLISNGPINNPDAELDSKINNIENALKRYPIPSNLTVYRRSGPQEFGLTLTSPEYDFNKAENIDAFKEKWEGQILTYPNFISTSIGSVNMSAFAKRKIVLRISIPKDSPGAYLSAIPGYAGEYEVLLNHGSKFKINKIDSFKDGTVTKLILDATLIP